MNQIESIQPGWNVIARQHGDSMRWSETGSIAISDARAMYDAGLIEMATSRCKRKSKSGRKLVPSAELVLQIRRRERVAERFPYFGGQSQKQPETA